MRTVRFAGLRGTRARSTGRLARAVSLGISLAFAADVVGAAGIAPLFAVPGSNLALFYTNAVAAAGDVNGDGYGDVMVGGEGAVYVFHGGPGGIPSGDYTGAATAIVSSVGEFGFSVAGAGDVNGDGYDDVIVGAPIASLGEHVEGAAFVFHGSAAGITSVDETTADAVLESNQAGSPSAIYGSLFGWSVDGAGDVNGDGYDDVVVGSLLYDAGTAGGSAFVFLGGASGVGDGTPSTAHAQLSAGQAGAFLGNSVAGAGDLNGDGFGDVAVAAPGYDDPQTNEGAVFVFHGSSAGIASGGPADAATRLQSNQARSSGGGFGIVDGAGDVNGDGYADLIVGDQLYDAGQTDEGAAFVFHGSPTGIPDGDAASAAAQLEADQGVSYLGGGLGLLTNATGAAAAGDVNGDGYDDVIVGAPYFDADLVNGDKGAAFLFLGGPAGIGDGSPASADAQLEADEAGSFYGWSVAGAGDVNGDGQGDVVVGRWYAGASWPGAAFVYRAAPACSNSLDDDGDGLTDAGGGDLGCTSAADTSEHGTRACDDGLDNDGDHRRDYRTDGAGDVGCTSPNGTRENPQCQDGNNNDGQLGTDFDGGVSIHGAGNGDPNGADPHCTSPSRNSERPSGCGLGFELAPLLASLLALRRRRERGPGGGLHRQHSAC
jgi:hypothetical protein